MPGPRRIALAGLALVFGCIAPLNLVPAGSSIASHERVRIDAGSGVSFRSLDGAPARAESLLVAPGDRSLRFEVRRNLRRLDPDRLANVYEAGTCRIRLETRPGEHYVVTTRLRSDERTRLAGRGASAASKQVQVGITILVRNLTRDVEVQVPGDVCNLRMDCRKIDRATLRPGRECSFE